MDTITIEWIEDESGYSVHNQDGDFIGDFFLLTEAAAFALAVSAASPPNYVVEILSVKP